MCFTSTSGRDCVHVRSVFSGFCFVALLFLFCGFMWQGFVQHFCGRAHAPRSRPSTGGSGGLGSGAHKTHYVEVFNLDVSSNGDGRGTQQYGVLGSSVGSLVGGRERFIRC